MYSVNSVNADEFICHEEVERVLAKAKELAKDRTYVNSLLEKAAECKGLNHEETAVLLQNEDADVRERIDEISAEIKDRIYGKRVVLFAPLYISDYCVNECQYCAYHHSNCSFQRRKLSQEEIAAQVRHIQNMGHKRIALEAGEDPVNCPIEYILESLETIYATTEKNGEIRRVNVNIAATTVENYRKLKDAGIGTYILFQETFHRPTYERVHPKGPKHNYAYHTEAMDRAMEGGIDDVGVGVLFGLYDYRYEVVALLMHALHLEARFGVGPHTISVPRLRPAEGVDLESYPYLVADEDFKKIVAVLRLAVPYTGIILSTRECSEMRRHLLRHGVSQISAGSCTGVGGYTDEHSTPQFKISDDVTPDKAIRILCEDGYIPSFCTACYREGRTGERFMRLAKSGQICNVCQPNALMTLKEYVMDYASPETRTAAEAVIAREVEKITNERAREITMQNLKLIEEGRRDFRL